MNISFLLSSELPTVNNGNDWAHYWVCQLLKNMVHINYAKDYSIIILIIKEIFWKLYDILKDLHVKGYYICYKSS